MPFRLGALTVSVARAKQTTALAKQTMARAKQSMVRSKQTMACAEQTMAQRWNRLLHALNKPCQHHTGQDAVARDQPRAPASAHVILQPVVFKACLQACCGCLGPLWLDAKEWATSQTHIHGL